MCEQCSAATLTYGEALPGIILVQATRDGLSMKKGQWGLVISNDPFVIWDNDPVPDPAHDMSDDEIDALPPEDPWADWHNLASEFQRKLLVPPRLGSIILRKSQVISYDNVEKDGDLAYWIFHRMGVVVAATLPGHRVITHAP